jgi:hypothetical protein
MFSISINSFALEKYTIKKGSMHRGGWIKVEAKQINSLAHMNIEYQVNPKMFIPGFVKKYLKGIHVEKLPKAFLYEEAYLSLERSKSLELEGANIYHQGRIDVGRYTNCHKVKIVAKNGKSEITAFYHPQVGDAGWVHINLIIKKIPLMKTYNLKADLNN